MTRGLRRVLTVLAVATALSIGSGAGTAAAGPPSPSPAAVSAAATRLGMMSVVDGLSSTGTYGAPLVDGCAWATWVSRCSNLTVYGNGGSFGDAGCGPPNGCTFGPEFQCTELAQRYAYYAWNEPAVWDGYGGADGSAAQMWQAGPALPIPLQQFTQGGGVPPQRGDLLIFGPGWLGSYFDSNGHVAVVTSAGPTSLSIVQENGTASGRDSFALNGSTVVAGGYTPVIGWLHNPLQSIKGVAKLNASSSSATGQQNLFWQGADNHLRQAWMVGTTWYGPQDLTAGWGGQAPLTSAPSAVFSPDGTQTVYWRGSGGHLWQAVFAGTWSAPVDLSAAWSSDQLLQSAPSAALAPDGEQVVYWQGAGGSLMETWQAGQTWYGPAAISGGWGGAAPLTSAPAVAVTPDNTELVFWQAPDGHLREAWYAAGWHGPLDLSSGWGGQGLIASAPSVVVGADGRQSVYWKGADDHVWGTWFKDSWNGPYDWDSLGTASAAPTATLSPAGAQVLYWQDAAGDLASATWNGGTWNGPADLSATWGAAGLLGSAPGVSQTADGSTQLTFWRGPSGHLLEAWYTGRWNGPLDLSSRWPGSALLASAPAVAVTPDGSTQLVFWQGSDGHMWEAWYTGTWNGPVDWTARWGAGSLGSAPSVWVAPDGQQQSVFWRGADGHLEEAWFAGTWNGPVDWSARWGSGLLASAPSAVVTADGAEQLVFWRDPSGHLQEAWFAGSWSGPSDWSAAWGAGALLGSAPSVVMTGTGSQLVFWQGTNGHLWEAWWGGGRSAPVDWGSAGNVNVPLGSAPSAMLQGGEQLVFWRGTGNHLVESWWGGPWSAPTDISGIGPLT